jgi:cytochrome c peroxidase
MRSAQTLTNVAYNATYTWANSALLSIEQQVFVPLFNQHPIEMGLTGHEAEVLDRFRRDTLYQRLFTRAFPSESDPYQIPHIVQALSSFLRTLISGHSAYDRFVYGGDSTALSASARRGLELAFSEELECHHCHGGFNFTLSTLHEGTRFFEAPFHNTGLYNVDGKGAYPSDNTGLYEVTGRPQDMGRFRAPTLRNIALTAPYMHDGSIASLEDVIRFYEQGGRQVEAPPHAGDGRKNPFKSGFVGGFRLTDTQRADLLAFLESLTDSTFICDPRFSNPFAQLPTRAVATR